MLHFTSSVADLEEPIQGYNLVERFVCRDHRWRGLHSPMKSDHIQSRKQRRGAVAFVQPDHAHEALDEIHKTACSRWQADHSVSFCTCITGALTPSRRSGLAS